MNCDRFEEELEKPGSWQTTQTDDDFTRHRSECPICQKKFAEYARLSELLKSDAPPMPDDSYWAVFPALVRERIESRKGRPIWKPALVWGSGLAALLLVAGIFLFQRSPKPDLQKMTAVEAFDYLSASNGTGGISLPEMTLTSYAVQAEDELISKNEVDELVYNLTEEQLKELEERLKSFKL